MNKKAISSLALIILMLVSAVIGGIIGYMLTIAPYVEMEYSIPENINNLIITDIYVRPEDASFFNFTVLNPPFSTSDINITKIALRVENSNELYEVTVTTPPIENGIVVPRGKEISIKCSFVKVKDEEISWGEFAYEFAGRSITINVFSQNASGPNRTFQLPYVNLKIVPEFNPETTFEKFNITFTNSINSETNLTIKGIYLVEPIVNYTIRQTILETIPRSIVPELPYTLKPGENQTFTCELNWLGINETKISIFTEEGYTIYGKAEIAQTFFIANVKFDKNNTESFKVTVKNCKSSASYITLTNITYSYNNNIGYVKNFTPIDIQPGVNRTIICPWNWYEYRGIKVNVTLYLKQGIKRSIITSTPQPIILEMLNLEAVFSLKDKKHFNIILQNHQSSLGTANITKIKVEEMIIDGSSINPPLPLLLDPGKNVTLFCSLGKEWTEYDKESLKLVVNYLYTVNSTQLKGNATFIVPLPKRAQLNITNVQLVTLTTGYHLLNITVRNMPYSVLNLTITKVIVTLENQTTPIEMQITPGQIVVAIGEEKFVYFPIKIEPVGEVVVKVITEEGIEASSSNVFSS